MLCHELFQHALYEDLERSSLGHLAIEDKIVALANSRDIFFLNWRGLRQGGHRNVVDPQQINAMSKSSLESELALPAILFNGELNRFLLEHLRSGKLVTKVPVCAWHGSIEKKTRVSTFRFP